MDAFKESKIAFGFQKIRALVAMRSGMRLLCQLLLGLVAKSSGT
jgi:hypothetical protein